MEKGGDIEHHLAPDAQALHAALRATRSVMVFAGAEHGGAPAIALGLGEERVDGRFVALPGRPRGRRRPTAVPKRTL